MQRKKLRLNMTEYDKKNISINDNLKYNKIKIFVIIINNLNKMNKDDNS